MIEKRHRLAVTLCHWSVDTNCILSCLLADIDVVHTNYRYQDSRLLQVVQEVPGLFDWVVDPAYAEATVATENLNLGWMPLAGHKSGKLLGWKSMGHSTVWIGWNCLEYSTAWIGSKSDTGRGRQDARSHTSDPMRSCSVGSYSLDLDWVGNQYR